MIGGAGGIGPIAGTSFGTARFTLYNLSGRYEQAVATPPDREFAETELATARELVQWLLAK